MCLDYHTDGTTDLKKDSNQSIIPCKVKLRSDRPDEVTFIMQRLLDTKDEDDFLIELDTDFEFAYTVNEETHDVTKWPTFFSSIYLVKYNPIQVYSDYKPTFDCGVSGAMA